MRMKQVLRCNRGFTLIDALAACVLLIFGLVATTHAMTALAEADHTTGAKQAALLRGSNVLASLQALPFQEALRLDPAGGLEGVVASVKDSTGTVLPLPVANPEGYSFPARIEVSVSATGKTPRGRVIRVETRGFLMRERQAP